MTKLPPVDAWRAQVLRLTAFPSDPRAVKENDWWQTIPGTEPDSSTTKKSERVYEWTLFDTSLQLAIDPVRVQWLRSSIFDPIEAREDFPNIGSFPEALDSFSRLITPWFDRSPPITRFAFGAVLLLPVPDHASGYRQLNEYLHFVELAPDTSDFQFKINRRRHSKCGIPELQINRLMSWSLLRWEGIHIRIPVPETAMSTVQGHACRLEVDINTSQEFQGTLPNDKLAELWDELTQLGKEIAREGDIP